MNRSVSCLVCLDNNPQLILYSICQCDHLFCLSCCQSQIKQNISSFGEIKCLSQNCSKKINQQSFPYVNLSSDIKQGYQKIKRHKYFQQNPNIKACKSSNCKGQFEIKKISPLICSICNTEHCQKCYQLFHEGQCDKTHEQDMAKLGYKKCAKCQIYVQKIQGCDYISCNCGNVFCYKCGVDWTNDPCRLKTFQEENQSIKILLQNFRFKKQVTLKSLPRIVGIGIVQILLMPLIIFCAGLVIPVSGFITVSVLFILFCPLLVAIFIYKMTTCDECIKILGVFICIILYPLISIVLTLSVLVFILLYPCIRGNFNYHHGIFDPFEDLILKYVSFVLNVLVCVIDM